MAIGAAGSRPAFPCKPLGRALAPTPDPERLLPVRNGAAPKNPTPLQKHVMFFDGDNDGKITYTETKKGLESIGLSKWFSWAAAAFINAGLASNTEKGAKITIDVANIKGAKHEGDTGAYDANGDFVSEKYNRILGFDSNKSGSLTWAELEKMIEANGKSWLGRLAATGEFKLLVSLAADKSEVENGKTVQTISFDRLKQLYDGTLFYTLAGKPIPKFD